MVFRSLFEFHILYDMVSGELLHLDDDMSFDVHISYLIHNIYRILFQMSYVEEVAWSSGHGIRLETQTSLVPILLHSNHHLEL